MVTVSWTRPSNAGVCCDQFRVITSNGPVVTSETQYTMEITRGERTNISVRCSNQGGTVGPQTNIPTVKQGALVKFASDRLDTVHYCWAECYSQPIKQL